MRSIEQDAAIPVGKSGACRAWVVRIVGHKTCRFVVREVNGRDADNSPERPEFTDEKPRVSASAGAPEENARLIKSYMVVSERSADTTPHCQTGEVGKKCDNFVRTKGTLAYPVVDVEARQPRRMRAKRERLQAHRAGDLVGCDPLVGSIIRNRWVRKEGAGGGGGGALWLM